MPEVNEPSYDWSALRRLKEIVEESCNDAKDMASTPDRPVIQTTEKTVIISVQDGEPYFLSDGVSVMDGKVTIVTFDNGYVATLLQVPEGTTREEFCAVRGQVAHRIGPVTGWVSKDRLHFYQLVVDELWKPKELRLH